MKHFAARLGLAVGCILALTGATWETRLPAPSTTQAPSYIVFDKRPSSWQKNESTSQGCADGAYRIGEQYFDPKPTVLLHAMLVERFGDRLAGKTVHVRGFSVHLNQRVRMDAIEKKFFADKPIPRMFAEMGKPEPGSCPAADIFGSYAPDEVPKDVVPLIVAADIAIDGKRFMGRAIAPSPSDWPARPGSTQAEKDAWNAAVAVLVQQALQQLGDRIEAGLFAPAVAQPAETQPAPAAGATH